MPDLLIGSNNDFQLRGADLATDGGLETTVRLCLGTDARALPDDVLPDGSQDRRGWWGDAFAPVAGDRIGSRRWLLAREKQRDRVLRDLEAYDSAALDFLVEDGVAERVEVEASIPRPGWLLERIRIWRPEDEGPWEMLWEQLLWGAEDQKVVEETAPQPLPTMEVAKLGMGRYSEIVQELPQRTDLFAGSEPGALGDYIDAVGTEDDAVDSVFGGTALTALGEYNEPVTVATYDVSVSAGALGSFTDNVTTEDTNTNTFGGSASTSLGDFNDG